MMRKLLGIALAVAVLIMPAMAKAEIHYGDDFSDTSPKGIWSVWTEGGGSFSQNGGFPGVLNFTSGGAVGGDGQYSSNFSFDLSHDFYVKTQFNYSPTSQQGGVGLGFYSVEAVPGPSTIYGSIDAVYGTDGSLPVGKYFVGGVYDAAYTPISEDIVSRSAYRDFGWLGMYYDSALDKLKMGAFNAEPAGPGDPSLIWGTSFDGLKTLVTSNYVGFSLSGWAETGATLNTGEAAFDNFNATSTVPEPMSTILFITGGTVLAVRRLRRK